MSILPNSWPVNWMEQALYVNQLSERLGRLEKIQKTVLIRSRTVPTRAQFESAYLAQTGYSLPIEVGTKLLWLNLYRNEITGFSTAYDLEGGLISSGDIYPLEDIRAQSRGHIRLLGVSGAGASWWNPYHNTALRGEGAHGVFIDVDAKVASQAGLMSFLVLFSADAPEVKFTYQVRSTSDPLETSDVVYESVYNTIAAAADNPGVATGGGPGFRYTAVRSGQGSVMPSYYTHGMLYIANGYLDVENGRELFNMAAVTGSGFASGFSTTVLAAGVLRLNTIAFTELENSPFIERDTFELYNMINASHAWLYGIYNKDTYE